jgi:AcrR family transcriptional regulator
MGAHPGRIGVVMAQMESLPVRERIIHTAMQLFYAHGIRAVGIDRIIAESNVAKMSFYRYFPSKEDLVRAFLQARHQQWLKNFSDWLKVAQGRKNPKPEQLIDALLLWYQEPGFRGCAFINAVAELGDSIPGVTEIARNHKGDVMHLIADWLRPVYAASSEAISRQSMVVLEGAIVQLQMHDDPKVIIPAKVVLGLLEK